jgi:CBS domain-containing protein
MMKVAGIMDAKPATGSPNESASAAWDRLESLGKQHLVVVRGSELVGVLSMQDLSGPSGGVHRRMGRRVGELMRREVRPLRPSTSVRTAAARMRRETIGCLPVVGAGHRLVGVVTVAHLLSLLERKL